MVEMASERAHSLEAVLSETETAHTFTTIEDAPAWGLVVAAPSTFERLPPAATEM